MRCRVSLSSVMVVASASAIVLAFSMAPIFVGAAEPESSEKPQPPAPESAVKVEPKDLPKLFPAPPPVEALQPGRPKTDPQAVAIVNKYLRAIGGLETLAAIQDRKIKFLNVKTSPSGDTEVEIALYLKKLGDYALGMREEWDVKGYPIKGRPLAFTQIYNGKKNEGWVFMLGTVSPLDGKTLQVFVWDKHIDDFFCHWEQDGYTLTMGGEGLVSADRYEEEEHCDVVNVTDFMGRQTARCFFSRRTGLLVKKEWDEAGTGARPRSKKEQYYKEYRDIGFLDDSGRSVKFPLRLEIYTDNDLDTFRRFTSVEFNSGLSDKLFEEPKGKTIEEVRKEFEEEEQKEKEKAEKEGAPAIPIAPPRRPGVRVEKVPSGPEGAQKEPTSAPEGPPKESVAPVPEGKGG